jgi:type I restriction enzyme S subunit
MKFGLEQNIIDKLIAVFEQHPKVDKALVFGSRAKGNYRTDSDIDIAIKGQDLNTDDIIAMSVAFEEKGITHKIDLINYDTIKEPELKDHIDRVGIDLYSRWRESKLGDYIETINGFAFKSTDFFDSELPNSLPIIKIKNVANGDVNLDGVHYHLYNDNLKKYIVGKGDILISLTGNHPELETQVVGLVSKYKLDTKALLNQRVGKILSKITNELNDEYLYYFLKNKDTHQYLASQSSGSANQANISKTDIEKISFPKPPILEQIAIASILTSLDDKIDLLHRQNKTLEQLTETFFRHWFVEEGDIEFLPLKTFVDVIDNRGKTPPFSDIKTDFPIVEVKSLSNNDRFVNYEACEKYVNEETYKNWFRKGHPIKNDILISTVGSIGEMAFVIENKGGIAQNVIGLRAKNISPFYLYQFLSLPKTRREVKDLDIGAVQPSIKVPHLLDLEIPIPKNKNLINEFDEQLMPIFEKMKVNHFQIKTLTQSRDTLLPKLMSGELRVNL